MLYRLDHVRQAGTAPVCDLLGPILFRRYKHALTCAREEAATDLDGCVIVTRISTYGSLSQAATVYPDGLVTR